MLDYVPRRLDPAQYDALRRLGRQVMALLESRRREHELVRREARTIEVFRGCPLPMAIHGWPDRTFTDVNAAFTRLLGWTPEEVVGRTMVELGLLEESLAVALRARLESQSIVRDVEVTVLTRAGGERQLLASTALVGAPGRQQAITTLVDITDGNRAEASIRAGHERFQIVARATNDVVWDWDLGTDRLWWNENFEILFGYPPAETEPTIASWTRSLHPDDRDRVVTGIHAAIDLGGYVWAEEYQFRRADGSYADIFDRGYVIRDAQGRPVRMIGAMQDITDRKQIERALRESEGRLRLALDAAQMGTFDWDLSGNTLTWSNWHEALWGFEPGGFDGTYDAFTARVHPDDTALLDAEVARCISLRAAFNREFRVVWPDGSIHWIAGRGDFTFAPDGRAVRMRGTAMEVTARKQAEQSLLEHKNRLAAIVDTEPECVKVMDRTGRLLEMNPAGLAMLEVDSLSEAQQSGLAGFLSPADREPFRQLLDRVFRGESGTLAFAITGRRGTRRWLETHAAPLRDADGGIYALLGVTRDITEQRKADARIRHLNRVYAVLSEVNETIVRERDPQAMLQAACRIAVQQGQFEVAWVGLVDHATGRLGVAAHAGASDDTLALIQSLISGDGNAACAVTLAAFATGRHGICNDIAADPIAAPWRDAAIARGLRAMASLAIKTGARVRGTFNLYSAEAGAFDDEELGLFDELATDISFALDVHDHDAERRRVEQALRESEERFRQLADNVQEVFWVTDPAKNRMLYVSPAYERVWGRSCASLYDSTRTWLDAVHPDDRERVVDAAATRQTRGEYDEIYRILRPDGTIRWIHDRAFPIRDGAGAITRIVGTAEDVSERRQLEEQLRQSQKMDAIGQLAGGVAHDFNNILAAIMMQADLAATTDNPLEARELLNDIKASADRAANLTRQLLAFSRRQVMQSRQMDLNEIVTAIAKMLLRILGEDVSLQLTLHPRQLSAVVDPGMLDQVLLNLVVNARDAMPGGGRLAIDTGEGELTADEAAHIPDASPGRHVWLSVADTGAGIAAEHLPHIFEPFFTTKESGRGTGLGLATVFGIVRQHGGWLAVETAPGRGTTFRIFLRAEDDGAAPRPAPARPALRRGTATILLVEDEPAVRMLARVILERQGYHVLEAAHGHDALLVFERHAESIQLLLTDMVMPQGMTGRELATRLQALKPALKVIFTSGYSADIAGQELDLRDGQNFIQKPFSPRQLLAGVERGLDG